MNANANALVYATLASVLSLLFFLAFSPNQQALSLCLVLSAIVFLSVFVLVRASIRSVPHAHMFGLRMLSVHFRLVMVLAAPLLLSALLAVFTPVLFCAWPLLAYLAWGFLFPPIGTRHPSDTEQRILNQFVPRYDKYQDPNLN